MAKGTLIPIGGNEDKGAESLNEKYTLDFIDDGILATVVKESGGLEAKIVVVPTASSIQDEVGKAYLDSFARLGCKNVQVLSINSHEEAESETNMNALTEAKCIMFSGGDQSKITKHIKDTKFHDLLNQKYQNEPFVIAGTSAGAMCMSFEMIAGGRTTESLLKGSVRLKKGMGFVPELVIDSHFIKRGRFSRLAQSMANFPHLLGVGLAEDTGIVIKDKKFTVIGSGMVVVCDPSELSNNNINLLEKNMPLSMTDLKVHILAFGDTFDIEQRKPLVMTMEEYNKVQELS